LELYSRLRDEMRQNWQRDLPFEEMLFDRWERAKSLGFGEGSSIYHNSYVYGDVKVGKNTWIGPYTLLDGSGGLGIGDYCSISAGVHIYTHDSVKWALSGGKAEYEHASVKIGNSCYIGSQTIISKGVKIGNHCLIGANSIVNNDLDDYLIAGGSPCKVIGQVRIDDESKIELVINHGIRDLIEKENLNVPIKSGNKER
jgi:acetyltransferase-like isoleucine patch superfamily enzyme